MGVLVAKVTNWCAACTAAIIGAGPNSQPTFQPVNEKVLPALEMVSVRSRMPGSEASGTWRAPSYVRCS